MDLDDSKIQTAIEEGVNPMEIGAYPKDVAKAKKVTQNIPVPVMHGHTTDVQRKLEDLLSGYGLSDVNVEIFPFFGPSSQFPEPRVDIDLDLVIREDPSQLIDSQRR